VPEGVPLLVFADDWGRHPSSCQHLVRHLLPRHEVVWVNTIMRPPRPDLATLRRGGEKVRQWLGARRTAGPSAAGPRVLNPRMWPWSSSPLDRRLNRWLLARQLGPVVRALPAPPVAVTTLPIVADLIGVLPVDRWVYYCVDDFSLWPGLDGAALRRMEEQLVRRVDEVIAVSETLRDRLVRMGRPARLLTHGVEPEFWVGGGRPESAPAVAGLDRPLVVFWGVLDRRMDTAVVRRLANDLGRGTIMLAGPHSDPDTALLRLPRVVAPGPLPLEQLPGLAREAAVLVMPYADLPVTRAMQPLKLKEYLATGKPVVVRDLPATRPWADCLDLADNPEAFAAAVRQRLHTGLPVEQRLARERLAGETWAAKARAFERWLGRDAPGAHARPGTPALV
jgi:glycosyltransferase involved in cell wall biosynthesis